MKKIGIKKCYFCEPIFFFLLVVECDEKDVSQINVIYQGGCIEYAHRIGERYWSFSRVLKNKIDEVELVFCDCFQKVLFFRKINVDNIKEIPKEFSTGIGTKENLTVNKSELEFFKKQEQVDFLTSLTLVCIELASLCNLKCKFCIVGNNYNEIERGVISDEILDKTIADINKIPTVNSIQLNALGEPLVNQRFAEICEKIYNETKVRNILFFTNGMLLTKDISDRLSKIPLNFLVFFSIDGRNIQENEMYRSGSDYDVVKNNIYYFLDKVYGKGNFNIQINNLQLANYDDNICVPEFLLNDFGFIDKIDSHRPFFFPDYKPYDDIKSVVRYFSKKSKKICRRVFNQTTVRSNGDIIRCHWDSRCRVVMGNIMRDHLINIWNGEAYVNQRKIMSPDVGFEELHPVCQKCHAMNEGYIFKE
jgi:radical SAM protein with 4Fe4S-binding SPASM domain